MLAFLVSEHLSIVAAPVALLAQHQFAYYKSFEKAY